MVLFTRWKAIITQVRKTHKFCLNYQLCGEKWERKACCDIQGSKVIKEDVEEVKVIKDIVVQEKIEAENVDSKKLGSFTAFTHKIAGTVFQLFHAQFQFLLIKDFNYDGKALAPVFIAGTTGTPSGDGEVEIFCNPQPLCFPGSSALPCP